MVMSLENMFSFFDSLHVKNTNFQLTAHWTGAKAVNTPMFSITSEICQFRKPENPTPTQNFTRPFTTATCPRRVALERWNAGTGIGILSTRETSPSTTSSTNRGAMPESRWRCWETHWTVSMRRSVIVRDLTIIFSVKSVTLIVNYFSVFMLFCHYLI